LDAQGKAQTVQARHQAAEQQCKEAEAAQKLVAEHQAGYEIYLGAERSRKELETRARQLAQLQTKAATLDKQVALHDAKLASLSKEIEAIIAAEKRVVELSASVIEQTRLEGDRERAGQQRARSQDLQRVIEQQRAALQSAETRRAELLGQLKEAQSVEQQIQTTTAQLDERQKALLGERETLAHLKSQAELIKEQSQRLEDVHTSTCPLCEQPLTPSHRQEMLKRNNGRLDEMRARYREASKQVQTLEAALQGEQVALKQRQESLLRLPRPDEATKLDEEITRAKAQLDENANQLATFGDATKQLAEIESALAALGDPASEHNVAQARAKQRSTVESQLESAARERESAQTQLGEVQVAMAQFGNLDAEQEAIAASQQKHAQSYKLVLANQQKAMEVAARTQEVATLAQEVKTLVERCAEHERAYKAATAHFDEQAYSQARDRSAILQREVGTLRGQLQTMQEQQGKAQLELADLRSLSGEVATAEGRKKQLLEEEDVLETIRDKLRKAGPYISEALNRQISDGARQIFSDLMQDYSRNLSWNKDYSITLEVDGRERSFSQLSGGEQMSAALSVRLALLREMSNIDIAFFDEPTANLDEVRREALARQILNVRGFRQLFVISHDDTFEQATQNLIRVERVDGASRVLTH
jgi:exonuclease SbcC